MNRGLNLNENYAPLFTSLLQIVAGVYPINRVVSALSEKGKAMISGPGSKGLIQAFVNVNSKVGGNLLIVQPLPTYFAENVQLRARLEEERSCEFISEEYDNRHKRGAWLANMNEPCFSNYTFGETIGLWLASKRNVAADLIPRQIAFGNLSFSSSAYLNYCEQIRLTKKRFQQLPDLPPVLQELHAGIFKHQALEDCQHFVNEQLSFFIPLASDLQREYTVAFNLHYKEKQQELKQDFIELNNALEQLEIHYNSPIKGKSRSQKKQQIERGRTYWGELKSLHQKVAPFIQKWSDKTEKWSEEDWGSWAASYKSELLNWQESHRNQLRETQIGLSLASVGAGNRVWSELIQRQTHLFEQINNTGLFQRPLSGEAGTLLRSQKLLEQLLEKLYQLQRLLPVLPNFYQWQRNWFDLPAELRRVVACLMNRPQDDWVGAFAHWYFSGGLEEQQLLLPFSAYTPPLTKNIMLGGGEIELITSDEEIPNKKYNLIILLGKTTLDGLPDKVPVLEWCCPSTTNQGSKEVITISRNGHYLPGLAFCQYWTSRQWANWTWIPYPASSKDTAVSLSAFFGLSENTDFLKQQSLESMAQNRWSILVQDSPEAAPRLLGKLEWKQGNYHKAVLLCTNLAAVDDLLGCLLFELWGRTNYLQIMMDVKQDIVTNALLSDGFSGSFALAATLRGIEAIQDADRAGWEAIAAEVRKRTGFVEHKVHPLLKELLPMLKKQFPSSELSLNYGWRDIYFPLLIEEGSGAKTLVLVDDILPGADNSAIETERRREIQAAGFMIKTILSAEVLAEPALIVLHDS